DDEAAAGGACQRFDVAAGAAGEPAREGEAKTRSGAVAAPLDPSDAGLEDALAFLGCDTRAVVVDRVADGAVGTFDGDVDRTRAVSAGVVEQRLQDALAEIGVDGDADRGAWRAQVELDPALDGKVGARCGRFRRELVGVSGAALEA